MSFEKTERKIQRQIGREQDHLRRNSRRAGRTILARIRRYGAKTGIAMALTAMSLFANYNKAYADTNKIIREVSNFNTWLQQNVNKIQEGTMSWEEVSKRFEAAFEGLEEEVRRDIEAKKYEKAMYNLNTLGNFARSAGNEDILREVGTLINLIELEKTKHIEGEGIFNVEGTLYVVGTVRTNDYSLAQRRALTNARQQVVSELQKKGINQANIRGTKIIKLEYLEGQNSYKYYAIINQVNDRETTAQVLSTIPQADL